MSMIALAQAVQITQATVKAILTASTVVVVALIALIAYFASSTPQPGRGVRSTSVLSSSCLWGSWRRSSDS